MAQLQHTGSMHAKTRAAPTRGELIGQVEALRDELAALKSVAGVFGRWHQDMIVLTQQNGGMHGKGEDLEQIVRHLIMTSLNAAIEAARAGESARGFVVVAAEVRSLALKARALSKELGNDLSRSALVTTATFQDIQATEKMMMAAISSLEARTHKLLSQIS